MTTQMFNYIKIFGRSVLSLFFVVILNSISSAQQAAPDALNCFVVKSDNNYETESCTEIRSSTFRKTYRLKTGKSFEIWQPLGQKPRVNGFWSEASLHDQFGTCYPILEENISFCIRETKNKIDRTVHKSKDNPPDDEVITMLGRYGNTNGCTDNFEADDRWTVSSKGFDGYEWGCNFERVTNRFGNLWQIKALCSGEGNEWIEEVVIAENEEKALVAVIINDVFRVGALCSLSPAVQHRMTTTNKPSSGLKTLVD